MPGLVVHTLLADAALSGWGISSRPPPFDTADAKLRAAFFRGAMAPDMGYYPGGVFEISNAIHRGGSGDMVRCLIGSAENALERAYAWGWLTHILADVVLHPAINQAAGCYSRGPGAPPLTYADDPTMHLRIEIGLDAYLYARHGGQIRNCWSTSVTAPSPTLLASSFRSAYGDLAGLPEIVRSELALTRFLPLLLRYTAIAASRDRLYSGRHEEAVAIRRQRTVSLAFPLEAMAMPIAPSPTLLRFTRRVLRELPGLFQMHVVSGLESLANFDLDTGRIVERHAASATVITAA